MRVDSSLSKRAKVVVICYATLVAFTGCLLGLSAAVALALAFVASLSALVTASKVGPQSVKISFYTIFLAPQALSIFSELLNPDEILAWAGPSYVLSDYNPFAGVKGTVLYLGNEALFSRAGSILAVSQLSLLIMLACLFPILIWGMNPPPLSNARTQDLKKLALTLGAVSLIFAALSLFLPLHSSNDCVRRCSNIAGSNFPRLNLFLFSQSLLIVLPVVIVRTYKLAQLMSKYA